MLVSFEDFIRIQHNWVNYTDWLRMDHLPIHFKTYWINHLGKYKFKSFEVIKETYFSKDQEAICRAILNEVDYVKSEDMVERVVEKKKYTPIDIDKLIAEDEDFENEYDEWLDSIEEEDDEFDDEDYYIGEGVEEYEED